MEGLKPLSPHEAEEVGVQVATRRVAVMPAPSHRRKDLHFPFRSLLTESDYSMPICLASEGEEGHPRPPRPVHIL